MGHLCGLQGHKLPLRYLECLDQLPFDLPRPSLTQGESLPSPFVSYRLSLVLYLLVYFFYSLVYTPTHPLISLHQALSLSSFILVVRSPTYLYTCYSCIRVFYKYCLYSLVPSIKDVLEIGYHSSSQFSCFRLFNSQLVICYCLFYVSNTYA